MSEPAFSVNGDPRRPHARSEATMPNVATLASQPECECLKAEELARFLGVNRKTVYEYAARNVIPHQRLGRRIVFSREQVVAWLGACRASPTGKAI